MSDNSFTPNQGNTVLTPEGIFISLYVDALRSLQGTWLNERISTEAFAIQITFLINMIPDTTIRETIWDEMVVIRKKYKGTEQERYAEYHAGLAVVSHMIEFLCNSFDLIHTDISGPATSKQYRDAVLEIPDYIPHKEEAQPKEESTTKVSAVPEVL